MTNSYHGAIIPQQAPGIAQVESWLGWPRRRMRDLANRAGGFYAPFDRRPEGSAKWRHIDNPGGPLKELQRRVYKRMLASIEMPEHVLGGVPGRSIRDNAARHAGQPTLVGLDLTNFYPSIDPRRVYQVFTRAFGCKPKAARLLTQLTTFHRRLPQGAPTSPMLANLIALPTFEAIRDLGERQGFETSSWVDDIVLSGEECQEHLGAVIDIVHAAGFRVNTNKVEVMHGCRPHRVTGLNPRHGVCVPGAFRRELREAIYDLGTCAKPAMAKVTRVWDRIAYVESISLVQGLALRRFADKHLPPADPASRERAPVEIRPCKSGRRHVA